MDKSTSKICLGCRSRMASYLEGDLDPAAERCLEDHVARCPDCRRELNDQKKFLRALDSALDTPDAAFELPDNFAKVVAASAESNVRGLRCPNERGRAAYVIAALSVLVLAGLGADSARSLGAVSAVADRAIAVFGFFGRLAWDLTVAATVILKSLCSPFSANPVLTLMISGPLLLFAVFVFSRLVVRHGRA